MAAKATCHVPHEALCRQLAPKRTTFALKRTAFEADTRCVLTRGKQLICNTKTMLNSALK
jgi:hypothetical protein